MIRVLSALCVLVSPPAISAISCSLIDPSTKSDITWMQGQFRFSRDVPGNTRLVVSIKPEKPATPGINTVIDGKTVELRNIITNLKPVSGGWTVAEHITRWLRHFPSNTVLLWTPMGDMTYTDSVTNSYYGTVSTTYPVKANDTYHIPRNNTYHAQYRGGIASFDLTDPAICSALSRISRPVIMEYRNVVTTISGGSATATTTVAADSETKMTVKIATHVSATPASLNFGLIPVGGSKTLPLSITVRAPTSAAHVVDFSYTSDKGTGERLTVDGRTLPYSATRVMPSDTITRTESYNVGITSSNAGSVSGRLLITARVT